MVLVQVEFVFPMLHEQEEKQELTTNIYIYMKHLPLILNITDQTLPKFGKCFWKILREHTFFLWIKFPWHLFF